MLVEHDCSRLKNSMADAGGVCRGKRQPVGTVPVEWSDRVAVGMGWVDYGTHGTGSSRGSEQEAGHVIAGTLDCAIWLLLNLATHACPVSVASSTMMLH